MKKDCDVMIVVNGHCLLAKIISENAEVKGSGDFLEIEASHPICIHNGALIAISSKRSEVAKNWTLLGYRIDDLFLLKIIDMKLFNRVVYSLT